MRQHSSLRSIVGLRQYAVSSRLSRPSADRVPQSLDGSLGLCSQLRFEFGEGVLNRIEVGTVGLQVESTLAPAASIASRTPAAS